MTVATCPFFIASNTTPSMPFRVVGPNGFWVLEPRFRTTAGLLAVPEPDAADAPFATNVDAPEWGEWDGSSSVMIIEIFISGVMPRSGSTDVNPLVLCWWWWSYPEMGWFTPPMGEGPTRSGEAPKAPPELEDVEREGLASGSRPVPEGDPRLFFLPALPSSCCCCCCCCCRGGRNCWRVGEGVKDDGGAIGGKPAASELSTTPYEDEGKWRTNGHLL